MGFKAVKTHYEIEHFVYISEGNLHIGSAYIPDIVVVQPDGTVVKLYDGWTSDTLLSGYAEKIEADPELFSRLFAQEDQFDADIPVFSSRGAEIIESKCEALGWPNVTHDGELMHDNTHFTTREEAIANAREGATTWVERLEERLEEAKLVVAKEEQMLAEWRNNLAALEAM